MDQWSVNGQSVNSSSAAVKKSRSIVVVHAAVVIVTIPLIDRSMVDGQSIFTQRVNNVRSLFTFLLMTSFQFALVPVSFSALSIVV